MKSLESVKSHNLVKLERATWLRTKYMWNGTRRTVVLDSACQRTQSQAVTGWLTLLQSPFSPSLIRLLHVTQSNRHHAPKPILMHFLHTGIFPDWQIISPKRSIRIVLHGQASKNHHRKPIRLANVNQTPACKSTGITPRKQIRLAVVDEIPSPGKRSRGMDIVESLKFSCTGFGSDR